MSKSDAEEAAQWGCAIVLFLVLSSLVCLGFAALVVYVASGLFGHDLPFWPTCAAVFVSVVILRGVRWVIHK